MSPSGFTKLFASITESTIWCESDSTRIVWITMLAMADAFGRVSSSVPGLANRARVPIEGTRVALDAFLAPDVDSRTKDFEGRRIEEIDGGWRLLNHGKYRDMRSAEDRRDQNRLAQTRRRERQRASAEASASVSNGQQCQPRSAQAEAEAEKEIPAAAQPRSQREAANEDLAVKPAIRHETIDAGTRPCSPAHWRSRIVGLYSERVVNGAHHPLGPKGIKAMGPKRQRDVDAFTKLARERARARLEEAVARAQAQQAREPNDANDTAVAAARAALNAGVTDEALDAWLVAYFDKVAKDDYIAGTAKRGDGHERWRADLSYVVREGTFTRILES